MRTDHLIQVVHADLTRRVVVARVSDEPRELLVNIDTPVVGNRPPRWRPAERRRWFTRRGWDGKAWRGILLGDLYVAITDNDGKPRDISVHGGESFAFVHGSIKIESGPDVTVKRPLVTLTAEQVRSIIQQSSKVLEVEA